MEKISDRWAKIILWAGSYMSVILFALIGGYYWLKTDRNELKKECKKVLCVTLIFLVLEMSVALISYFISIFNINWFSFVSVVESIIGFAKIFAYAIPAVFALFGIMVTLLVRRKKEDNKTQSVEGNAEVEIVESNKEE